MFSGATKQHRKNTKLWHETLLNRPPHTPSDELRRALKWDTLFNRRRRCGLQLVHRCVNKYAPDYMMNRLCTNASLGCPCTRGHSKLYLNHLCCDYFKRSFEYMGSKDWNSLPKHIRELKSSRAFGLALRHHPL